MRAAPRLRALDLDAQSVARDQPAVAVGIREVVVLGVLAGGHRLGGEERRAELAELVDVGPLGLEHQVAGEHLLKADGALDRKALGAVVMKDADARRDLEAIAAARDAADDADQQRLDAAADAIRAAVPSSAQ